MIAAVALHRDLYGYVILYTHLEFITTDLEKVDENSNRSSKRSLNFRNEKFGKHLTRV